MGKTVQRTAWRRGACRSVAVGVGALALAVALGACEGGLSDSLGLGKKAPDEFSVVRSAPLTLPPDYTLRPPQPGAPGANQVPLREQAEAALLSEAGDPAVGDAAPASATEGEAALIEQAGATDVDPRIRHIVDREATGYASEDEGFVESLMFWRRTEPPGEVVDAEAEAKRLRENAEAGRPVTAGETPTIRRREKAPLEGIF